MSDTNAKTFFDGLLDVIIDYVEEHNAFAGLTMSHKAYEYVEEDDNETSDAKEAA